MDPDPADKGRGGGNKGSRKSGFAGNIVDSAFSKGKGEGKRFSGQKYGSDHRFGGGKGERNFGDRSSGGDRNSGGNFDRNFGGGSIVESSSRGGPQNGVVETNKTNNFGFSNGGFSSTAMSNFSSRPNHAPPSSNAPNSARGERGAGDHHNDSIVWSPADQALSGAARLTQSQPEWEGAGTAPSPHEDHDVPAIAAPPAAETNQQHPPTGFGGPRTRVTTISKAVSKAKPPEPLPNTLHGGPPPAVAVGSVGAAFLSTNLAGGVAQRSPPPAIQHGLSPPLSPIQRAGGGAPHAMAMVGPPGGTTGAAGLPANGIVGGIVGPGIRIDNLEHKQQIQTTNPGVFEKPRVHDHDGTKNSFEQEGGPGPRAFEQQHGGASWEQGGLERRFDRRAGGFDRNKGNRWAGGDQHKGGGVDRGDNQKDNSGGVDRGDNQQDNGGRVDRDHQQNKGGGMDRDNQQDNGGGVDRDHQQNKGGPFGNYNGGGRNNYNGGGARNNYNGGGHQHPRSTGGSYRDNYNSGRHHGGRQHYGGGGGNKG